MVVLAGMPSCPYSKKCVTRVTSTQRGDVPSSQSSQMNPTSRLFAHCTLTLFLLLHACTRTRGRGMSNGHCPYPPVHVARHGRSSHHAIQVRKSVETSAAWSKGLIITFSALNYHVKSNAPGAKKRGEERAYLLKGVSGYFKPGEMSALVRVPAQGGVGVLQVRGDVRAGARTCSRGCRGTSSPGKCRHWCASVAHARPGSADAVVL